MDKTLSLYTFNGAYELADLIQRCVQNGEYLEEIDWSDDNIQLCLAKPQRPSLLEHYIFVVISIVNGHRHRKEGYSFDLEDAQILEERFSNYNLGITSFGNFCHKHPEIEQFDRWWEWVQSEEESFHEYYALITDEVHHILFANRAFLLQFNRELAQYLLTNRHLIPIKYVTKAGKLKRVSLPRWLKTAVFFRDRGRCVLCQSDLTGLLSTSPKVHFDHIVPLKQFGSNDPSNFQLLCEKCNLNKSGTASETGYLYNRWWPE